MSLETVGRSLVEMCEQGKNFDAMRALYASNVVSVEGDGNETRGKDPVIHKSEIWQEQNTIHSQVVHGPYFNRGQFSVHFTFDVTRKASKERVKLEEVAIYTVEGDEITREQFFYDGEH